MAKYHIPITFILEIEMDSKIIESDMVEDAAMHFISEFKNYNVEQNFNEVDDDYQHKSNKMKVIEPTIILGKRAGYCL